MANRIQSWFSNPISGSTATIAIATVVIAIATVTNLALLADLWTATREYVTIAREVLNISQKSLTAARELANAAQDVFETANRPYIGSAGITTIVIDKIGQGKNIRIKPKFKNYGTTPAEETETHWFILINGIKQEGRKLADQPRILFPSASTTYVGTVGTAYTDQVLNGDATLQVILLATYSGPKNKYTYCEKQQYHPEEGLFVNLGRCDPQDQK